MMGYLAFFKLPIPETILVITVLLVLGADLTMRELDTRFRLLISSMIASVGCIAAIAWILLAPIHGNDPGAMLVVDSLTQLVKAGLLVLTVFTIWISVDTRITPHVGEYLALILLAAIGMMFLVSSADILMIFISLELTSLSLYILTAFNKHDIKSAEAALKYFLFGGMSAAFTLFGLSLVYGVSGATNLREIANIIGQGAPDPLLIAAMVMVVIGFGFKVAAVPFHLWAPDAYQGAPVPSAAFIASGSKLASFFIFAKLMMVGFAGAKIEGSGAWHDAASGWVPAVAIVALLSMVLGNLVAIVQSSVKRLIAYSAIAHAGYMLLGVISHSGSGLASLIYYAVTYGLTTIGAFGVIGVVENATGNDKLTSFAGLSRRAPIVSFCMLIFMLSLAGIPPLAGFFGKFYLFTAAVKTGAPNLGLLWLVILAIAMSAVSLYYYLQVLKQVFVADLPEGKSTISVPVLTQIVLGLLALAVIVFGCVPGLLVGLLEEAVKTAAL